MSVQLCTKRGLKLPCGYQYLKLDDHFVFQEKCSVLLNRDISYFGLRQNTAILVE